MTMKRLATFGLISTLALFLFMVIPTYSQSGDTTVIINQSVGGTTNPGAGVTVFPAGDRVYLTAIPNAGYVFVAWEYLGPFNFGFHNSPTVFYTSTVSFNCAGGNTVQWQADFAPA